MRAAPLSAVVDGSRSGGSCSGDGGVVDEAKSGELHGAGAPRGSSAALSCPNVGRISRCGPLNFESKIWDFERYFNIWVEGLGSFRPGGE